VAAGATSRFRMGFEPLVQRLRRARNTQMPATNCCGRKSLYEAAYLTFKHGTLVECSIGFGNFSTISRRKGA
jgi:hypothetical protein